MKTQLYSVIALLVFVTLIALPNSFAQGTLAQPSVRLVYFLPSDRPDRPDRIEALRQLMKDVQAFYADQMAVHGYGRKTFRVETDTDGKPVVHRVNGKFNENYYYTGLSDFKIWEEVYEHFDELEHIYFVAIDVSYETLNDGDSCGLGGIGFLPMGGDANFSVGKIAIRHRSETSGEEGLGGSAIIPASGPCFFDDVHDHNHPLRVTTHELAHAFGLDHDFRKGVWNSKTVTGGHGFRLSDCAAEWLSVHRFFNTKPNRNNRRGSVKLREIQASGQIEIHLRFDVNDPDGLHQAQLLVPEDGSWGALMLIGCQELDGQTQTVEFTTTELTAVSADRVVLQFMDNLGNITWATIRVDIADLLPPPKVVSIPDQNLAAAVRDALELDRNARITDRQMLKLRRLDAKERQIKNLTGLEHALYLQWLELRGNQIDNIRPLANLKYLTELILERNHVSNIRDLVGMKQLILLYLGGNPISNLTPLADLTELERLSLWETDVHNFTLLSGMTKLTHLYLWNNNIRDITPLSNLTQLKVLHLSGNEVSNVRPLAGLVNLQTLYLQGNPIKNREPLLAMLRRNPEIKIYLKAGGDPLPVSLSHFRAELTEAGVSIKWTTESELDNAGFNILRSETKDGEFNIVTPQLIQGAGTTSERHTYTWKDTTAKPNIVYYYRIEDISHAGVRKQLATVRLKGYVSASNKFTTKWGDLKLQE